MNTLADDWKHVLPAAASLPLPNCWKEITLRYKLYKIENIYIETTNSSFDREFAIIFESNRHVCSSKNYHEHFIYSFVCDLFWFSYCFTPFAFVYLNYDAKHTIEME